MKAFLYHSTREIKKLFITLRHSTNSSTNWILKTFRKSHPPTITAPKVKQFTWSTPVDLPWISLHIQSAILALVEDARKAVDATFACTEFYYYSLFLHHQNTGHTYYLPTSGGIGILARLACTLLSLYTLHHFRKSLSHDVGILLTQSLVLSFHDYSAPILTSVNDRQNEKLYRLSNACVRFAFSSISRTSFITQYRISLGWLSATNRHKYLTNALAFSTIRNNQPITFYNRFRTDPGPELIRKSNRFPCPPLIKKLSDVIPTQVVPSPLNRPSL